MKNIFFSIFTISISIIGFVILPMFIIDVDLKNHPAKDITPVAIEARKNLDRMKEYGTIERAEDVEKWWREINSQPKVIITDKELYQVAQENFLWFSWIPVFVMFYFFSKHKRNDFISFIGIAICAWLIEVITLYTLGTYVLAALAGVLLKMLVIRKAIE